MWGRHLKRRGNWWHYYRAVPERFRNVEARAQICFSLKTTDLSAAKAKAAQISFELEQEWVNALERGVSLSSSDTATRYAAAVEVQLTKGFKTQCAVEFVEKELIDRLRTLLDSRPPIEEQKALLGLVPKPKLSMMEGFNRFWEYIEDEWTRLSHDQRRVKRNGYLKALSNFQEAVGDVPLYDLERSQALEFRTWWLKRLQEKGLKAHTGNKDFNALRRLVSTNFDMDGVETPNPFAKVRLKEDVQTPRMPFSSSDIEALIQKANFPKLSKEFHLLLNLLVNTGMRPVEAVGLELDDIVLDHEIPHVHVRKNSTRGLKTAHSERLLPLLGVSLHAAEELVVAGGWGKHLGKNMYATSVINRNLRDSGIVTEKRQSLYSLRHWFQDQLTKRDVVDRAQAQLMGHKFQRPKYGYGKDLSELRDIIEQFAIEAP